MQAAKPPEPTVDPNFAAQQAAAQNSMIDNLQVEAAGDTANLMSRYGAKLALANAGLTTAAPSGGAKVA